MLPSSLPTWESNFATPRDFKEKPDAAFCLIDPILQQARGCDIILFVAQVMHLAHTGKHSPVVFAQFGEHVRPIDILRVVIAEALQAANVPNGVNRNAANLAYALGDIIRHRENLVAVLIEQQMVVTKVRSTHVPMKVLGLQVKSKNVGQQHIESGADVFDGFGSEVTAVSRWRPRGAP